MIGQDPGQRLLADLEALWRLTDAVARAGSVPEIVPVALDAVDGTVAPDRSAILLFDADGVMRFEGWRGLSDHYRAAVDGHSPWQPDTPDPQPVLIEDPATEPTLAALLPTIEAEGIRSLAFVPLATRGRVLGKFMLYYDAPHRFTADEILVAEAIASHVAFAIDRREVELDLERSRQLLDVITRGLTDGITVQDRTGALVYANEAAARMAKLPSADAMLSTPVAEIFGRFEMLDDQGAPFAVDALPGRRVLAGETTASATMQVLDRTTGERAWRSVKAGRVLDDDGRVAFAVNIMEDLTAQKALEHDLRFQKRLLELQSEASLEGILVVSPEGRIVSHNRRFTEMWGMPESVLGWPDDERIRFIGDRVAAAVGFVERVEWLYAHPTEEGHDELVLRDGRVVERYTVPIADTDGSVFGRAWFFRDVSDRRRAENEQRLLAEASEILSSSLDAERTLRQVANVAVRGVADWCTVHLVDGTEIQRIEVAHREPAMEERARELLRRYPPDPARPNLVLEAVRAGRPTLIEHVTDEMLGEAAVDETHLAMLRDLGLASIVIVPLRARGATLGALTFISSSHARAFSPAELPLFEELARRASIAIDNARLYGRERTTAAILQESLLPPRIPDVDGLEIATMYLPFGDGAVVGGDLYDVFEVEDGRWIVMIGDVCGHGPRAAAIGSSVRHAVRVAAMHGSDPARVLRVVNDVLLDRADDDDFCTACVLRLERDGDGFGVLTSSAGHPLPIVLRADGAIETLGRHGTLLGVFADVTQHDVPDRIAPGDTIVLFTDGLEERRCADEFFSTHAFGEALHASIGLSAAATVENLRIALRDFGTPSFADDVAVLAMRVRDAGPGG
ncbi:MAG TPA: SpoIIE family protein phosphatase [Actinomycetota bacterium]|nr:SpoIIE family protein phosphatase [Actinomycetota bacterium]